MRGFGRLSSIVGLAIFTAAGAGSPVWAQSSRTWVSSTGSGAVCSRAAPCAGFQAAHDAAAAGGEINCVDAGSYGAVTITKSLTIDCTGVFGAGFSGTGAGVFISTAGVNVVLRGLSLTGGTGSTNSGIVFTAGESLTVENVTIRGFGQGNLANGILFQPGTAARLHVVNSLIANNGELTDAQGDGIRIRPLGAGYANVTLEDVRLIGNIGAALAVDVTGNTGASTSVIANRSAFTSSRNGVSVTAPAGTAGARITLLRSIVTNNILNGLLASGPAAQILASNTAIGGNSNGVLSSGGGSLGSYGNNELIGNGTNGTFNGFLTQN